MFSKLLKHEFKQQGGLLAILSGAALIAGLLGGLAMRFFAKLILEQPDSDAAVIGEILAMMLMMAMIFAIIAYSIGMMILLVYRFYKRHFSDEGYLTFTLPANTHQILLSSITHIAIWSLITGIVAAGAIIFIVSQLMSMAADLASMPFDLVWQEMRLAFGEQLGAGYLVLYILNVVAGGIYSLILPLLAITIGSVVAKKHKLLAAFGIYYGVSMVLSTVTSVISVFTTIGDAFVMESTGQFTMYLTMSVSALLYLGIGIGGYFIMHALVDKKLNLP